jgi:hypothetical protein
MTDQNESLHVEPEDYVRMAREALDAGNAFRFRAAGESMLPTIRDGEAVTLVSLDDRRPKMGDIILHRTSGGGLALHRIVRMRRRGLGIMLYTRGDAFGTNSEVIEEEDVLARAVSVEREGQEQVIDGWRDRLRGLMWALRQTLAHHRRTLTPDR